MITKKIQALVDTTVQTKVMSRRMVALEVAMISFSSQKELQGILSFGKLKVTDLPVGRNVPIIEPPANDDPEPGVLEEIPDYFEDTGTSPVVDAIDIDQLFGN